jgi:tetratricopeptide (TPR) repeat protein
VDRLEDELRHVLQSASVIGRVFRRRVLERVATQSSDIEQALWELEDRALIYQGRTVPEPEYVFRHALTQDAVYQTVVQRRRTEFHGTVAREMEALYADDIDEHVEQLAYHYELSTDDDRAVEYLIRAGEKARRNHVNEPAIELFRRALSRSTECVVEGSSLRCQLDAYLGLGRSYLAWGDAVAAEDPLRRAVEAGRRLQLPARERVRVCYWLCECLWWRSGHDENRQLGQECLGLLGDDTECIEAVLATQVVAAADFAGGDGSVWRENTGRTAPLLLQLPYCEELRAPR